MFKIETTFKTEGVFSSAGSSASLVERNPFLGRRTLHAICVHYVLWLLTRESHLISAFFFKDPFCYCDTCSLFGCCSITYIPGPDAEVHKQSALIVMREQGPPPPIEAPSQLSPK